MANVSVFTLLCNYVVKRIITAVNPILVYVWYLVVDVLALWSTPGLQDVVVIAVVNDEDPTWSDHTGDVSKGQLLVTLVP